MEDKKNIKSKANAFLKITHGDVSLQSLSLYLKKRRWKLYYFNGVNQEGDPILKTLGLTDYAGRLNSFYNRANKLQIVFMRSGLTEQETVSLLLHEIAHILLEHTTPINSSQNIQQEDEANYFVGYVKSKITFNKYVEKYKKTTIAIVITIAILTGFTVYQINYKAKYYITPTGIRYHIEDCRYIQDKPTTKISKHEAENDGYTPCKVCIGK